MREKMGRGSKHLQKEQQKQINRYRRRQISEKKIPEKIAEELRDRTKKLKQKWQEERKERVRENNLKTYCRM